MKNGFIDPYETAGQIVIDTDWIWFLGDRGTDPSTQNGINDTRMIGSKSGPQLTLLPL